MDLEVTIQAFWLVSALKDTKVYDCLKSAGRSSQAALIETRSTASGSIGESLDWLSLSLKVPIASRVGFVSLVASFPSAKCNLILTRAHSGVIYMARSMEIGQKISEATRYAFACILPDHFAGISRAGFAKRRCHEMPRS